MRVDLKFVLSTSASITTILLFLAALPTAYKIIRRKSVGDDSCAPYTTSLLSCVLWFMYGALINDQVIQLVNVVGIVVQIICVNIYVQYSPKRMKTALQQGAVLAFIIPGRLWIFNLEDKNIAAARIGLTASVVSLAFFAAPLTKLMHVIRTASTECLPFPMITMSFVVSLQWALYGLMLDDAFIVVPNMIGCALSTTQLLLFWKYPSKSPLPESPRKEALMV